MVPKGVSEVIQREVGIGNGAYEFVLLIIGVIVPFVSISYDCPPPPVPTINWGDAFYVDTSASDYQYLDQCCYIHFMPGANGERSWNLTGFNVTTDPIGDELIQDTLGNTYWYVTNGDGYSFCADANEWYYYSND